MSRVTILAVVTIVLAFAVVDVRPAPAPFLKRRPRLPVGRWEVKFANGVVETCVVNKDGTISVSEPARSSAGKAVVKDGASVLTFDDSRVERWTAKNGELVVEHWFPASAYPAGRSVVGAARRVAKGPAPGR
jgi:hypothetical protein